MQTLLVVSTYADPMSDAPSRHPDRRPPSVDDAARQFLHLSREYLELVPILKGGSVRLDGRLPAGREGRTARRVLVLSMALGRKFLTSGEPVYPPGLLRRVTDERSDRLPRELRKKVTGVEQELAAIIRQIHQTGIRIESADGRGAGSGDYWDRALNGHTLHADYGKWAQHGPDSWGFTALHGAFIANRIRRLVAQTRWFVTDLGERGVLDLGDVDTTPGDEIPVDLWAPDGSPAATLE